MTRMLTISSIPYCTTFNTILNAMLKLKYVELAEERWNLKKKKCIVRVLPLFIAQSMSAANIMKWQCRDWTLYFTLTKTKLDLNLLTAFSCHRGVILSQIIYEPNMFCSAFNYADRKITQRTDFFNKKAFYLHC